MSEDETWGVVEYIKKFSKRFEREKPRKAITVGSVPPSTPESVENGKKVYQEMRCARCHGTDLQGDGPIAHELYDIWDHRVFVYELTDPNTYKFGFNKKDLFLILTTGIDGTPMKSYSYLTDEERWNLASYIESKIRKEKFQPAQYEIDLTTHRIDQEINMDPGNPLWDNIPVQNIHMIPLNARRDPVDQVQFQSVVNDEGIAFRLEWEDSQPDRTSSRHQDFKDAIAMQFALGEVLLHDHGHNEPFFGMGNRGKVVNIWQWRADWQTEIETKEKLEYATKGLDLDTMIFGGEVNPVDALNPFRPVKVKAYWIVALTKAIQNIRCMYPRGGVTNQIRTRVASANRKAINRIGGKSVKTKATLAKVKPSPQVTGTDMARMISKGFMVAPVPLDGFGCWRGASAVFHNWPFSHLSTRFNST